MQRLIAISYSAGDSYGSDATYGTLQAKLTSQQHGPRRRIRHLGPRPTGRRRPGLVSEDVNSS
ncbi:MAG: hypothetical protein INR71_14825 [Terriglobus roseus]|nr:hypothetical protein [Terriglobus roseus]